MGTSLILLGIGLLIAAAIVFAKGLKRAEEPRRPGAWREQREFASTFTFDPRKLGPGATVSCRGVDYVVRGTVTLRQHLFGPDTAGHNEEWFVWWEHLLDGGDEPVWFSVKVDEGRVELALWTRRNDLNLRPYGHHVVDGETFREHERARASYTTEDSTGLPASGHLEFVEYINSHATVLLSIKRWAQDMPREIWIGRTVLPAELTVNPTPTAPT